ncbi:hypothetical protein [Blastopirellula marina]|uniref:Uncharacterized protein n=1 Tax=Blastopirellula marina TaxID=124 RepID=A0A2S8GS23_9BACT|nr:hypothetical protein [Blastopirellula marina]PQO47229.1 hypothetical protein C5Y93_04095 [Blastopirellula marina]
MNSNLLTAAQMRQRYGDFYAQSDKTPVRRDNVPPALRPLIPYAELWGLSDDLLRDERTMIAPPVAIEDLKAVIVDFDNLLDDWLAGDEADSPYPSPEYIAFSAMRMAADFA